MKIRYYQLGMPVGENSLRETRIHNAMQLFVFWSTFKVVKRYPIPVLWSLFLLCDNVNISSTCENCLNDKKLTFNNFPGLFSVGNPIFVHKLLS